MPSAGFEPAIPVILRPHTYGLDGRATVFGNLEKQSHQIVDSEFINPTFASLTIRRPAKCMGETVMNTEDIPTDSDNKTILAGVAQ